ncbi:hypothetical protein GCM10010254_21640 [Streptomyces chromofuscus]|nr:hypothetical protein GCM10010254_21640 [Streptomyces chromofuscus]
MPGWPYPFVAALKSGRTSWCQILDALRPGPADDVAEVTAAQVGRVVADLITDFSSSGRLFAKPLMGVGGRLYPCGVRYADGGGLTPAGRRRRESVPMQAAESYEQEIAVASKRAPHVGVTNGGSLPDYRGCA